jgi:hypothetical protein
MQISFDVFTMLFVGNISYLLLTISMLMTRMSILRIVAIGSGISGGIYDYFWLNDPVGTFCLRPTKSVACWAPAFGWMPRLELPLPLKAKLSLISYS